MILLLQHKAFSWTNAELSSIANSGTNFIEILLESQSLTFEIPYHQEM